MSTTFCAEAQAEKPTKEVPREWLIENDGCLFPHPDKIKELEKVAVQHDRFSNELVFLVPNNTSKYVKGSLHKDGLDGECFYRVEPVIEYSEEDDGMWCGVGWREV